MIRNISITFVCFLTVFGIYAFGLVDDWYGEGRPPAT